MKIIFWVLVCATLFAAVVGVLYLIRRQRKTLPVLTPPLPPVTGTALRQDGPEVKFQEPPKPPPAGT